MKEKTILVKRGNSQMADTNVLKTQAENTKYLLLARAGIHQLSRAQPAFTSQRVNHL